MARADDIDTQFPYIQIARNVGPRAAAIASLNGITYQHARGGLECLWENHADRRVLQAALKHPRRAVIIPRERIGGVLHLAFGVPIKVESLVDAGFLEDLGDDGYRMRGMSRYLEAEESRLRRIGVRVGSKSGATPLGPHSDPTPTPQTKDGRLKTVDVRRKRKDVRLKTDLSAPAQPELPGTPGAPPPEPRKPSTQESLYEDFVTIRESHLEAMGVEPEKAKDERPAVPVVNAVIGKWLKLAAESGVPEESRRSMVYELLEAYVEEPWPAKYDPPWPFSALASDKVWPKLWERVRQEWVGDAPQAVAS